MRHELPTTAKVQPLEQPPQEAPAPSPPQAPPPQRVRQNLFSTMDTEDWLILAVLVLSLLEDEEEPGVALIAAALYLFLQ